MFETKKQGSVDVIRGDAPLVATQLDHLQNLVAASITGRQPCIVLDLERVPLFDSAGLEWLLTTHDECLRKGGAFKLAAPTSLCTDILRVTGVGDRIELFPTVVAAIGSCAR